LDRFLGLVLVALGALSVAIAVLVWFGTARDPGTVAVAFGCMGFNIGMRVRGTIRDHFDRKLARRRAELASYFRRLP
jgi:hypothetical protein